jgi:hypothetical protein
MQTASLHAPQWKQMPMPEPYLTYLSGSPLKEPSPEGLCTEPDQRETSHS